MRNNKCEMIRRELDELMLNEAYSASAGEHLKECLDCREFHQTQIKLRQMVGSLGPVAAPPDFDFRLRARLANDAGSVGVHDWSFARKGLAFGAVLVVFATGMFAVRNVMNQGTDNPVIVERNPPPVQQESPKPAERIQPDAPPSSDQTAEVRENRPNRMRVVQGGLKIRRPMATVDRASTRAGVIPTSEAVSSRATAVIPIDASLPSLKFSLDDGSGNPRTISVPTIRFGSQRMLPNANQFAQKGIW